MKVKLTTAYDEDRGETHRLSVGEKKDRYKEYYNEYYIASFFDCPEDAIIGRGLIDGYDILDMLKLGHELGKKGEELEIEIEVTEDE